MEILELGLHGSTPWKQQRCCLEPEPLRPLPERPHPCKKGHTFHRAHFYRNLFQGGNYQLNSLSLVNDHAKTTQRNPGLHPKRMPE
eukprot:2501199-Amphidinium_carterae.1